MKTSAFAALCVAPLAGPLGLAVSSVCFPFAIFSLCFPSFLALVEVATTMIAFAALVAADFFAVERKERSRGSAGAIIVGIALLAHGVGLLEADASLSRGMVDV